MYDVSCKVSNGDQLSDLFNLYEGRIAKVAMSAATIADMAGLPPVVVKECDYASWAGQRVDIDGTVSLGYVQLQIKEAQPAETEVTPEAWERTMCEAATKGQQLADQITVKRETLATMTVPKAALCALLGIPESADLMMNWDDSAYGTTLLAQWEEREGS